ncbi:MAG TPA: citryl-CoA lyase [Pyrinomonadaceae bacterium]|nr:citryl-CoA lyase [Pyrinomonadaceae bacterium]
MSNNRKTSISWVEAEKITLRGYAIEDLIGRISLGEAIFLLLMGEMPTKNQAKMLEAILVSVIDHGVRPPSTIAAVTVANTGASLNSAIAAGILAINKYHGGAIEDAMKAIAESVELQTRENLSAVEAAEKIVQNYKSEGKRISGFGHRFHDTDPRTVRLFELAKELKVAGKFVEQAEVLEKVLSEKSGRNLPINADGAIAALLCEMNFPPKTANGIFMIARVAGLVAHAIEEQERNPPMRTVSVEDYEYDGETEKKIIHR